MQKTEAAKTGTDSDTQIRTQFLEKSVMRDFICSIWNIRIRRVRRRCQQQIFISHLMQKRNETDRWESQEQLEQVTNDEVLSVMDEWKQSV